ncbi:hypothetical protein XENORESO_000141 [Xenotaenia resolanae]|uniref:Uncharacterized protein n=1 Tax=Xenotaenia resolanae TaxID=208358 RepID=A0ABV0WTY9_9TELE
MHRSQRRAFTLRHLPTLKVLSCPVIGCMRVVKPNVVLVQETVAGGFTSSVSLSCAGRQCWRQESCEKTSDPNCPPSVHIPTSLQGWRRRKRRPDCRHGAGRNERRKKKSSLSGGGQDWLSLLD